MKRSNWREKSTPAGAATTDVDPRRAAFSLLIAYAKQETVEPLKGLARFVAYGTLGAFAIALGTVLLLVAVLRILQTETGAFHGNLSWVPYVIVSVLAALIMGAAVWRISAGEAARRLPPKKTSD